MISEAIRNPRGLVFKRLRQESGDVCTSIIVVAELRFGLAKNPSMRLAAQIERMIHSLSVIDFRPPAEAKYGEIRAYLERLGKPIGGNDLWIAAHALALDATLITANEREFRRVPGLRVENWTLPQA